MRSLLKKRTQIGHWTIFRNLSFHNQIIILLNKLLLNKMSELDWEDYQLRRKFPNTEPGSEHDGIDLQCFFCGEQILEGADIHEIKRGAVWTNSIPEGIHRTGKKMFNKYKKCSFFNAVCTCGNSVGSVYLERYEGCTPNREFPCVKVTYMREARNGTLMNATVLNVASEEDLESIVENLTLSDDQDGVTESGVRLNTKNFDKYSS